MTPENLTSADFRRIANLASQFVDDDFRDAYMVQHLKMFLADQFRAIRGDVSQKEFGKTIGKPQSVVSRLEDETYGQLTVQTLLDVVTKLKMGLLIRVVDFPTFLLATSDASEGVLSPRPFNKADIEAFVRRLEKQIAASNEIPESSALRMAFQLRETEGIADAHDSNKSYIQAQSMLPANDASEFGGQGSLKRARYG